MGGLGGGRRWGGREGYCKGAGKGCKTFGLYGMANKNSNASINHRALAVKCNVLGTLGSASMLVAKAGAQKYWFIYTFCTEFLVTFKGNS